MRGSTGVLAALVALFLVAFFALRAGSPFLAIEADPGPARALAAAHGLAVAEVFALREQAGDLDADAFGARVAVFAALRAELGDELAAVAVAGGEAAARHALLQAGGDRARAWQGFQGQAAAFPGLRFQQMRDRFAGRAPARVRD